MFLVACVQCSSWCCVVKAGPVSHERVSNTPFFRLCIWTRRCSVLNIFLTKKYKTIWSAIFSGFSSFKNVVESQGKNDFHQCLFGGAANFFLWAKALSALFGVCLPMVNYFWICRHAGLVCRKSTECFLKPWQLTSFFFSFFFFFFLRSPAISLGFTTFGWDFCVCDRFFFNPTIKVVTFRLRGWCVLGVFLLPAFTHLGHECQDLLSPCDEMHVCTD